MLHNMKWQWLDDYKEQWCTENMAAFQDRKKCRTCTIINNCLKLRNLQYTYWSENVNYIICGDGDWCFKLELSNVTNLMKTFLITSKKV